MTQAAKDAAQRVTDSEQRESELEAQLKETKKEVKRLHTQANQLEREKDKLVKTVRVSTEEAAKAKEVRDRVHGIMVLALGGLRHA
jgi:septal ring factor EnvC (AmiA/AmiB activator)